MIKNDKHWFFFKKNTIVRVGYQINPIELSKILIEIDCKLVENFDRKRLWSRAYDALPLFEKHSNEKVIFFCFWLISFYLCFLCFS